MTRRVSGLVLAAAAAAAAAVVGLVMTAAHLRLSVDPWYMAVCSVDATFLGLPLDCELVNRTAYGSLLGIPLSVLGFAFYIVLLLLAGAALRGRGPAATKATSLLLGGATLAVAYAFFLLWVQLVQIRVVCPFCQQAAVDARRLESDLPDRVRLVFKHYPLDGTCNPYVGRGIHPGACEGAAAAVCSHKVGKFWPYHDRLFARQQKIFEGDIRANLIAEAERVGISRDTFIACLDNPDTLARVRADVEAAQRIQVPGTPAFLVNGRSFFTDPLSLGALSVPVVRYAIATDLLLD